MAGRQPRSALTEAVSAPVIVVIISVAKLQLLTFIEAVVVGIYADDL